MRLGSALGPYQQDVVVSCYGFPDGFWPLLPAINALLIAPYDDVVGLESAFELLYRDQVMTRIADEHPWHFNHSTLPVWISESGPPA